MDRPRSTIFNYCCSRTVQKVRRSTSNSWHVIQGSSLLLCEPFIVSCIFIRHPSVPPEDVRQRAYITMRRMLAARALQSKIIRTSKQLDKAINTCSAQEIHLLRPALPTICPHPMRLLALEFCKCSSLSPIVAEKSSWYDAKRRNPKQVFPIHGYHATSDEIHTRKAYGNIVVKKYILGESSNAM